MKERSNLVLLFYILSFINLVSYIIFYPSRMIHPRLDPFVYNKSGVDFFDFMQLNGVISAVALGWLVCCTMQ